MKSLDHIVSKIAKTDLNITTLATRRSDSLDFHNVAVWQVEAALKAAFDAGVRSADKNGAPKLLAALIAASDWIDAQLGEPRCEIQAQVKQAIAEATGERSMNSTEYSPAPWSYEYSPYRRSRGEGGIESELPAYEVFDADGNKVFDTNEDSPGELQEANARMGAAAPRLLAALVTCANLLADYDESDGPEGEAYREALAAVTEATGRPV
jgi:hypothetical protein